MGIRKRKAAKGKKWKKKGENRKREHGEST
jgi:hypothetical protein